MGSSNRSQAQRNWIALGVAIWAAQRAVTKVEFDQRMMQVQRISPAAYRYLSEIDDRLWTSHVILTQNIPMYKKATDNDVEQEMNRFMKLGIRTALPVPFFQRVMRLWTNLVSDAVAIRRYMEERNCELTPYAYSLLKQRTESAGRMQSDTNGAQVYTILTAEERATFGRMSVLPKVAAGSTPPPLRLTWETSYETKICSCGEWAFMCMICAHGVHAAYRLGKITQGLRQQYLAHAVGECWHRATYEKCFPLDAAVKLPTNPKILS